MPEPSPQPPRARGRVIGAIRLTWAAGLLVAPTRIIALVSDEPDDPAAVTVARILGVRHVIQGAVEVTTWPRWRRAGAVVDFLHAMTGLGLAAVDRRWRRAGLADAALASSFAAAAQGGGGPAGVGATVVAGLLSPG